MHSSIFKRLFRNWRRDKWWASELKLPDGHERTWPAFLSALDACVTTKTHAPRDPSAPAGSVEVEVTVRRSGAVVHLISLYAEGEYFVSIQPRFDSCWDDAVLCLARDVEKELVSNGCTVTVPVPFEASQGGG